MADKLKVNTQKSTKNMPKGRERLVGFPVAANASNVSSRAKQPQRKDRSRLTPDYTDKMKMMMDAGAVVGGAGVEKMFRKNTGSAINRKEMDKMMKGVKDPTGYLKRNP